MERSNPKLDALRAQLQGKGYLTVTPKRASGPHGLPLCRGCGLEVIEGERAKMEGGRCWHCAAAHRAGEPPRAA